MSGCVACGRGFHRECGKCRGATNCHIAEGLKSDEETISSSPKGSSRKKRELKDPASTGRKRAAELYPIEPDAPCEWRGLQNCGGGRRPIIGCYDGVQKHRHHGPVKNTTRNEEGNVHRICTACVEPSSLILKADLTWVRADDIREGDWLIAFDENIGGNRSPKIKYTQVEAVAYPIEPSYRFEMSNGIELISSHAHKWVASSPSRHHLKWYETHNNERGYSLSTGYNLRYWLPTWEVDTSYDAGWLAGYLDGEGSLSGYHLSVAQKLGDGVYEKGKELLEQYANGNIHYNRREAKGNWQDVDVLRLTTQADVLKVLGTVRPIRLLDKVPDYLYGQAVSAKRVAIAKKEYVGEISVVSIQTTAKTLVVNGFLSHNCHVHWHELNDLVYDEREYNLLPHAPIPATDVITIQNALDWKSGVIGQKFELASTKNREKHATKQPILTD